MTDTQVSLEPQYAPKDYDRAIDGTDLSKILLTKSSFEVRAEFYNKSAKRELSYDRTVVSSRYSSELGGLSGVFKFRVQAKAGRKVLLKCEAEYVVIYSAANDLNPAAAEAFCGKVGVFAAYPYFRAHCAQMSWGADANLPALPTIATGTKSSAPPSDDD